jgi:hypothetical protein
MTNFASAWVPMAERLPPTNTPILICVSDGTMCVAKFEHEPARNWIWWDGVGFSGYEWEWDWEWKCFREPWKGVTHWMLLPAPPKAPNMSNPDSLGDFDAP